MGKYRERIVGIDLGTTNSAIAYVDAKGHAVNIPNKLGDVLTPSVVQIGSDRRIFVGREACENASKNPDRTATNIKRDIGEKLYRDPLGGREFSPEALSALILKQLVLDARKEIGPVREAVITVPAYFGDTKRKATEDAGRIAGLSVVDVLNEPTAAALAHAFGEYIGRGGSSEQFDVATVAATVPNTTLVFDLGGGTFDVTVIRIDSNNFEVLATGGEVRLGGIDFDERLLGAFCDEFTRRFGVDPRDDPGSTIRIRSTCELAKRALTERMQTVIMAEHLGRKLSIPISRGQFEELTSDLVTRMQMSTEMLLEDAMLTWDRIDTALLVGGSTRMPCIAQMLELISGKEPVMAAAPEEIVSHGAAIHAAIIQLNRGQPITALNEREAEELEIAKPLDPDDSDSDMDPIFDESVAEAVKSVQLGNVNAHSLGVVVRSPRENRIVHARIIHRNTPLPSVRTKIFGTEAANQTTVRLPVMEGESRDPAACTYVGECVIDKLPDHLPQGSPVEVTFTFDPSGRLRVRAMELSNNVAAEVEIVRNSGFEKKEISSMAENLTKLMEADE